MKTVIEMARQVKAEGFAFPLVTPEVRRLCELVRADAIADEREAIDQLVNDDKDLSDNDAIRLSKAIKARVDK